MSDEPKQQDEVEIDLVVGLDEPQTDTHLRALVAKKLGTAAESLGQVRLHRRSIDARRGRVRFRLVVVVGDGQKTHQAPPLQSVRGEPPVVIIGSGPAGLFCAWALAQAGIASLIIERGKQVQPRRKDLKLVNQRGEVDPDSNYCFGEGGAGTYSDGKLYTRAHKRGQIKDVLATLVACGAPPNILIDARPHIGSNRLPLVIETMRQRLLEAGVQFLFESRVEALLSSRSNPRTATGVRLAGGQTLEAAAVVVATGHSARDVYGFLQAAGVHISDKAFAIGLRIEHPQQLIDHIQYGQDAGHPHLPAAAYRLAHTEDKIGVYSFCMCPGGFVVPATTEPGAVVVNGMSPSQRNSKFANSGIVQSVEPLAARAALGDVAAPASAGLLLQAKIERAAYTLGGGRFVAPASRLTDFLARRVSSTLPASSYQPGLAAADLAPLLDLIGPGFADRLRRAFAVWGRSLPGYITEDAVLIGVESRTSAPVRVDRDSKTLLALDFDRLYPCGEGAGYAGGIVSAALDGTRIAQQIASVAT